MAAISKEVQHRKPEYDIDPIFVNRWSPLAMSGEPLDEKDLMPLFEAARWAPSSYNNQSWRFIYAKRGTPAWERFFDLLWDGNKPWAKNAGAFVLIISKTTFDMNGKPSKTHSFDTGAAWENLALEGSRRGLAVHPMEGFDYDKAREACRIPDGYQVEAMIAIGGRAPKETLPPIMSMAIRPPSACTRPSEIRQAAQGIMVGAAPAAPPVTLA